MNNETRRWRGGGLLLPLLGLLALAIGCPTGGDDDDTTPDGDDDDSVETGCITVNGDTPGYAHLQDAIDAAQDGDAISVCAGTFEGSATVDKTLSIVGEDAATTILVGDINEVAVAIDGAAGVRLSGLTIRSTRNGIDATSADGLVLEDLVLDESGQYGVSIAGGDVELRDSQLRNHPFGAVVATGTTLTVTGCTIEDIEGYGVRLDSSDGEVSHTTIAGVAVPDATDDLDGTCIFAEDTGTGGLVVDTVELSGCTRVGIYGIGADLMVDDASLTGCSNGVVGIGGGAGGGSWVRNSTLVEVPLFGIRLDDQDCAVVGNALTVTDPGDNTYGITVGKPDGTLLVDGNEIAGYGRMGIWVQYPYSDPEPTGGEAVVTNNLVDGGDLYGVLVTNVDSATVTGNTVRSIRWSGSLSNSAYADGFGLGVWSVDDATLADNVVQDVDVVGLFLQDTAFASAGDHLVGNHLWAIYVGTSAGTFTDLVLEQNDIYGVDARTSEVEIVGGEITGMEPAPPPDQWEEPEPYYYSATAVTLDESQGRIEDTLFDDNADYHLRITSTDIQVEGCTFAGPASYGVYSYHGYGTLTGNLFDEVGTGVQINHYDPLLQIGDLVIEENTFQGNRNAIYGYYLAGGLTIRANDISATVDTSGYGSEGYGIYAWDFNADGATVEVRDNTFSGLDNSALAASNVDVTMAGSNTVSGVANDRPAIHLESATGSLTGVTVTGATGPGVSLDGATATVTGCDITSSSGDNLLVVDSAVQLTGNVAISDGFASGIRLEGLVTGAITGNTIADNALYGISCDGSAVSLTACENAASGNGIGPLQEENGCVSGCTVP